MEEQVVLTVPKRSLKTLGEASPQLVKEWDFKRNRRSPEEIPVYSLLKFWWVCSQSDCGHRWQSRVKSRYYGKTGCPRCANRTRKQKMSQAPLEQSLAFVSPYLMREWHPTKNGDLNAFEIYPHSKIRIWWKCQHPNCQHEWQTYPAHRVRFGSGCPRCARRYQALGSLSPKALYCWDGWRNEQSPFRVHPRSQQPVYWSCVICQTQWIESPVSFLRRQVGCWRCENGTKLHQTPRYRKRRSQHLSKRQTVNVEVKVSSTFFLSKL